MTRWIFAVAVAGGLSVLGTRLARAGEPASFEWSAPLSCPSREAMLQRLREEGGRAGATSPIDAFVTVEQPQEDRYRARVELVAGHHWSERSLEALSCDAIADAVIVIVRVAAAAEPAAPSPPESLRPVAAPPAPAPQPPPAPPPSSGAVVDERGDGFTARAAFALDTGTRYDATPGFGLGAAWRGPHVRFAVDFNAFAPPPTETLAPATTATLFGSEADPVAYPLSAPSFPADAHVWLLTVSAEGCASEPLRIGHAVVDACLGLALEHPRFNSTTAIGVLPMGEFAAEWWPLRAVGVRAAARGLLDLPRQVPTSTLVAFQPSLGLVVRLGK